MLPVITGRYLVAASTREIGTNLLYYDKVVFPGNSAVLDGFAHIGDRLLGTKLLEPLRDSGLYVSFEHVVMDCSPGDGEGPASHDQALLQWNNLTSLGVRTQEQVATRYVATNLRELGLRVTPGYDSDAAFLDEFSQGQVSAAAIVMKRLPVLDYQSVDVDELVAFVQDEKTQRLRRRLRVWENDLAKRIENGDVRIEDLPDMMASALDDYEQWLGKTKLRYRVGALETVVMIAAHIIQGLTLIALPSAVKGMLEFGKRGLELELEELRAPGRELAYISHSSEKFQRSLKDDNRLTSG
jgi:hypothetical protein